MTTIVHCITTKSPTLDIDRDLGLPILRWLAERHGVILWKLQGMYGLVPREYVAELDRLYKQDPKSNVGFVWSACTRVPPQLGEKLFTE